MNTFIETFNLAESPKKNTEITQIVTPTKQEKNIDSVIDETFFEDFKKSRTNVNVLMDLGTIALQKALEFAEESQDHKWYDSVATLLKSVNDINLQYLDNHEKVSKIRKNNVISGLHKNNEKSGVVIDKAVFIGSTKELLDQIKPRKINESNK